MNWQADNVVATVFFPPVVQHDAFQPWVRLFNGSPQQFAQNPAGQPIGSQSSGVIGVYQVIVTAQPGRLDLSLNPTQSIGPGPASISDVDSALTTLSVYFKKLVKLQEAVRLALVVNLSKPVSDPQEATTEFLRQTRLDIRSDATDVSFSANVAKSVPGVPTPINRICRWGTGQMQLLSFSFNGINGAQTPVLTTFHAATLQLDLSTSPIEKPFTEAEAGETISAFLLTARELIEDAYSQILAQR